MATLPPTHSPAAWHSLRKRFLKLPAHVAVGHPGRVADHHVGLLRLGRQPDGPGQIARHVAPDVVAALPLQAAHHAVGLAENKLVRRRGDALPVHPGGEIGRRLRALAKVDHVVEEAVEKQRVGGHRGGKPQRRRRQALRLRLRHLNGRNEYLQHLVAGKEVGLIAFVGGLRQVPLQGVAQIDRQGNVARMFPAQRRHERQQVGDACEDDGDGVNVDPGDLVYRLACRGRG